MHKLYELKDTLCKELEEYGAKEKLDISSLDIVDKLAHALKNLNKVIEDKENEGYSNSMGYNGYSRANYNSYNDGSYARGRGRYANRDSMGRYSSADDFRMEMQDLIANAPNEQMRQRLQNVMAEM